MTTPAPWTVPPGMHISDGAGGSKDPLGGIQITPPIEISSAQLLALHTTPKVLVAAQGPGKAIWPLAVMMRYSARSTPYDLSTNPSFNFAHLPLLPDGQELGFLASGLGLQEGDTVIMSSGEFGGGDAASFYNTAFGVQLSNAITLGDGTLIVVFAYLVVA